MPRQPSSWLLRCPPMLLQCLEPPEMFRSRDRQAQVEVRPRVKRIDAYRATKRRAPLCHVLVVAMQHTEFYVVMAMNSAIARKQIRVSLQIFLLPSDHHIVVSRQRYFIGVNHKSNEGPRNVLEGEFPGDAK